jgi:N-acetylmuramoyl-L-alanine amidase
MKRFYEEKGSKRLRVNMVRKTTDFWRFTPDSINQLKISIDPGHHAANWREAVQERKYIKIKGSDLGLAQDIEFYEADLNYATAYLLQDTLKKLKVRDVMITREYGESKVGKSFDKWFKEDFQTDTKKLIASGEISKEFGERLLTMNKPYEAYKYVYQYLDFVGRSRAINEFKPDVSIVMHYNAYEYGERESEGYWPATDVNYSLVFTPGSFLKRELLKKDARIEFLRLLLSPDLEESIRLASFITTEFEDNLGVKPMDSSNESDMIENNCMYTGKEGVYARNLYLTRAIESPIVYVEALHQDNKSEAVRLSEKNVRIGPLLTSKRVQEVAYAYLEALQAWMEANRHSNIEWSKKNMADGSY